MKSYSAQLLMDYIGGADIPDDVLEKLESNEEFMLAVFSHTRDISMFRYVSDSLKGNARFIRKLIEMFSDNYEFVVSVLKEFENKVRSTEVWDCMSDDQIAYDELVVVVSKIYDKTKDDRLISYKMYGSHLTSVFTTWLSLIMQGEPDIVEEMFDFGDNLKFNIFLEVYGNSPILLEYHFKHLIDSLCCIKGLNLEESIHMFYKIEDPSNIDSIEMALRVIRYNDWEFSEYLKYNPKFLDEKIKEIDTIKKRWNTYLYVVNTDKVENVINIWEKNRSEYIMMATHSDMYYFSLLVKELGLHSIFSKYADKRDYIPFDEIEKEEKESLRYFWKDYRKQNGDAKTDEVISNFEQEEFNENMVDSLFIEKLKKLMIRIFANDLPYEKQRIRVELNEGKEESIVNGVTDETNAIFNVDFVNKKIISVIRKKKSGTSNDLNTNGHGPSL